MKKVRLVMAAGAAPALGMMATGPALAATETAGQTARPLT